MKTKKSSITIFVALVLTALCDFSSASAALTKQEMEAITGSDCPSCWESGNPCYETVIDCDANANNTCVNPNANCQTISTRRNDDACRADPDGQLSANCATKACIEFIPGQCVYFGGCVCNPGGNMPQAGANTVQEGSGDSCF